MFPNFCTANKRIVQSQSVRVSVHLNKSTCKLKSQPKMGLAPQGPFTPRFELNLVLAGCSRTDFKKSAKYRVTF